MSNLANITKYYTLVSTKVKPSQLLLDPNNPRINVDVDLEHNYCNEEILSDLVQNDILKKINNQEYRVSELKKGISQHGFLSGAEPLIVEQLDNTNKFLVLEGNRRTSAIKTLLLEKKNTLPQTVLKTLELIEVKELKYIPNPYYPREEIIDILLGTIHLTGKVAWGAMEKAHYIFKTYKRELSRTLVNDELQINDECLNKLSEVFNTSKSEIRKNIWVYNIFQQLRKSGYKTDSRKFTLIELSITNSALRKDYFEMDESCCFSVLGLERFNTLCIEDDCPISNPDDFKKFQYIYRLGDDNHLLQIENGRDVHEIFEHLKSKKKDSKINDKLKDILKELRHLKISNFNLDNNEREIILQISSVINNKLLPAINENLGEETNDDYDLNEDWTYPVCVPDLLDLKSWQVQELIKEALKSRPNNSCVRKSLPTFHI